MKFKWTVYSEKQWVRMWGSHTGECVKEKAHPTRGVLSVPHPGVRDRTSRQLALSEEFTPKVTCLPESAWLRRFLVSASVPRVGLTRRLL